MMGFGIFFDYKYIWSSDGKYQRNLVSILSIFSLKSIDTIDSIDTFLVFYVGCDSDSEGRIVFFMRRKI